MPQISKRKLESYKRAEMVCQELRNQLSSIARKNENKLSDFVMHWMKVTGKVKYEIPTPPKKRINY